MLTTTVAVVSALAVVGSSSAADDPEATAAKKHYEEGTKAFNLGEYPRAITEFKATYNAKPDPLLLYNIAQSYRLQGDAVQALFFYKSFLRNMPSAANRKEVEGRIKTLDKQIADQKKEPAPTTLSVSPAVVTPAPQIVPPSGVGGIMPPPAAPPPPAIVVPLTAAPAPAGSEEAAAPPKVSPAGQTTTKSATNPAASIPPAPSRVDQPRSAQHVDLTTSTPALPPDEPSRPIYKKWWFWAGAGVAVLVIGGAIAAGANKAPSTQLGLFAPKFR